MVGFFLLNETGLRDVRSPTAVLGKNKNIGYILRHVDPKRQLKNEERNMKKLRNEKLRN